MITRLVVLAEYVTLAPDADNPDRLRLATTVCDATAPWQTIGMCQFAIAQEHAEIRQIDDNEDDR